MALKENRELIPTLTTLQGKQNYQYNVQARL